MEKNARKITFKTALGVGILLATVPMKAEAYCVPTLYNCMCTYLVPCPVQDKAAAFQEQAAELLQSQTNDLIGKGSQLLSGVNQTVSQVSGTINGVSGGIGQMVTGVTSTINGAINTAGSNIDTATGGAASQLVKTVNSGLNTWNGAQQAITYAMGAVGASVYVPQSLSLAVASPMWGGVGLGNLSGGIGGVGMLSAGYALFGQVAQAGGSNVFSMLGGAASIAQSSVGQLVPSLIGASNLLSSGNLGNLGSLLSTGTSIANIISSMLSSINGGGSIVFGGPSLIAPSLRTDAEALLAPTGGIYKQFIPSTNPTDYNSLSSMSRSTFTAQNNETNEIASLRAQNMQIVSNASSADSYARSLQVRKASVEYLTKLQAMEQLQYQDLDFRSAMRHNTQVRMAVYAIRTDIAETLTHILRLRAAQIIAEGGPTVPMNAGGQVENPIAP